MGQGSQEEDIAFLAGAIDASGGRGGFRSHGEHFLFEDIRLVGRETMDFNGTEHGLRGHDIDPPGVDADPLHLHSRLLGGKDFHSMKKRRCFGFIPIHDPADSASVSVEER